MSMGEVEGEVFVLDFKDLQDARYQKLQVSQPSYRNDPQVCDMGQGSTRFKMRASGRGIPVLMFQIVGAESGPIRGDHFEIRGIMNCPLESGKHDLDIFDPSDNEGRDRYKKLGSARVVLKVPFTIADFAREYAMYHPEHQRLARAEREQAKLVWQQKYQNKVRIRDLKYYFLSNFTQKLQDVISPAYYFVLTASLVEPASEDFVLYLYDGVAKMYGTTREDIEAMLVKAGNMTEAELLLAHRILGDMLTLLPNAHAYVSDHVGKRMVERFSLGCFEGLTTGDCEDSGMVGLLTFYSLLKSDNTPIGLRTLMKGFRPMLIVGAASKPSLEEVITPKNEYMCHVWAVYIPEPVVAKWKGSAAASAPADADEEWYEKLFPILGEGTNFASPLTMEVPFYIRNDQQAQQKEIERINNLMLNNAKLMEAAPELAKKAVIRFSPPDRRVDKIEDFSSFYRQAMSAWFMGRSADIADGAKMPDEPLCHHFMYRGKIGVPVNVLLRGAESDIKLEPHIKKHAMTHQQIRLQVAASGPTYSLKAGEESEQIYSQSGKVNQQNMAEFRFKSLRELGGKEPWKQYENHRLFRFKLGPKLLEVFILQVTP